MLAPNKRSFSPINKANFFTYNYCIVYWPYDISITLLISATPKVTSSRIGFGRAPLPITFCTHTRLAPSSNWRSKKELDFLGLQISTFCFMLGNSKEVQHIRPWTTGQVKFPFRTSMTYWVNFNQLGYLKKWDSCTLNDTRNHLCESESGNLDHCAYAFSVNKLLGTMQISKQRCCCCRRSRAPFNSCFCGGGGPILIFSCSFVSLAETFELDEASFVRYSTSQSQPEHYGET